MELFDPSALDRGAVTLGFEGKLAIWVFPVAFKGFVVLDVGQAYPWLLGEEGLLDGAFARLDILGVPLPELGLVHLGGALVDVADIGALDSSARVLPLVVTSLLSLSVGYSFVGFVLLADGLGDSGQASRRLGGLNI